MCRLFGLSAAPDSVSATFWLLDAPDSLTQQSHREPDGTGLGTFDDAGTPIVAKEPIAAFQDARFAREARQARSRTFIAHIRFATTGGHSPQNTHPFLQDNRLFAHNGVFTGLPELEEHLGDARGLVHGDTDSERLFALITRETAAADGDLQTGIATAVRWVATHLPLYSLNFVITTPTELYALRYPDTNDLFLLTRRSGGHRRDEAVDHAGTPPTIRAHSEHLRRHPSVVIATERMDDDHGWRNLDLGELIHVDGTGKATSTIVLDQAPEHLLDLKELAHPESQQQKP